MADRTITTDLVGRDRSLSKTLDKAGDSAVKNAGKMGLFGKEGDKVSRSVASWSGGFTKLTGKIALTAHALVTAAGGAQQMVGAGIALSGTLGLLPGIAASGAVAVGTLKLATAGFGAALKETDPKKLTQDLKGLAPAAASTVREINKIRPGLKGIQQSAQQHFFKGLADEVKPLAQKYFPMLNFTVGSIGSSFGGAARGVLRFAQTSPAVLKVRTILNSTTDSVHGVSGALEPLARALLNVVTVSAKRLPGLGEGIAGIATRFEGFIDKVTAGGTGGPFATWINTGLESVKSLGSALASVGRIIGGVFSAASGTGGSGLAVLASTLRKIADLVNTPAFQGGLQRVFAGIGKASDAIGAALPAVSAALVALAPALASLVGSAGVSFGTFLKTAAVAAKALAPALMAVAGAVAVFAPYLGPVAAGLYLAAKAQLALNLAMSLNPIGLVVLGLAALVVGITIAMQKSQAFRAAMVYVFKSIADVVLGSVSAILGVYGKVFEVLGHLPGKAGSVFRSMANAAKSAKKEVDKVHSAINAIPNKTVRIRVNTTYAVYGNNGGHYEGGTFVPNKNHQAKGGPVRAGQPYIVGDGGRPELFVPTQNGTIMPEVPSPGRHQAWSGGGDPGPTINVYVGATLANPGQIRDAVVEAFTRAPAGARKLPRAAVA